MRAVAIPLLAAVVLLAGCGSQDASSPAPSTIASTPTSTAGGAGAAAPMTLTVYPVRDGVVRPEVAHVPATTGVAAAALRALGLGDVPVSIANGQATVSLPDASPAQVAEVVYTLTRFPSVASVDVGGRTALTRADVADYAPLILLDQPAADATVPAQVHVAGSAVVFEASLVVELVRGGTVLDRQSVTATAGAPERGTFQTTLRAPSAGPATVVAFAPSAEDGSPQHEVEVPVTVAP